MNVNGIVIKKQPAGEYDEQITLYTREMGRVSATAKSILKPKSVQAMHLDVLNLVEFDLVQGRSKPIITGAQEIRSYHNLKRNLSILPTAYFILETVHKLTFENQKDEILWDFLVMTLAELDSYPVSYDLGKKILQDKQAGLLSVLGYSPSLDECVFCSRTDNDFAAFNPELIGVVCKECFLSGQRGVLVKKGDSPLSAGLDSVFESLGGSPFVSLNFAKTVLK